MSNRWLRFGIAFLALTAAIAAGYRIFQQEQRLATAVATSRALDRSAESAALTIAELKAALHAYVAEGQGYAFWTRQAAMLIDGLRAAMLELEGPATAAAAPMGEALDLVDRLAVSEQRAREHVRGGQERLAGEVIFTEARDQLDAVRTQVARTREAVATDQLTQQSAIRREQTMLALGTAGVLAFALLLVVAPGKPDMAPAAIPVRLNQVVQDDVDSSARVISREPRPVPGQTSTPATASAPAPVAPLPLREAAAICTDLGRVSQTVELSALLQRAATVLNASGVVVWMASEDRRQLHPAASAGYDERMIARIGPIARDASNVTAGAFRDAAARKSGAAGTTSALAVPLLTPLGPVGVLSAELRDAAAVDEPRLALATIFAAQLASLLGAMGSESDAATGDEDVALPKAQGMSK